MQATTCFHDSIPEPVLQEADCILYDPVTFHHTDGVFNADSDGRNRTIRGFLRGCKFSARGCFLGLDDRHVLQVEPLKALIWPCDRVAAICKPRQSIVYLCGE
jgi:hypothetical protein